MDENNTIEGASTPVQVIDPKDLFKIVLDTRNFEISNFWLRSNYFLVLNSALAIGFVNSKVFPLQLGIAALGLIAAMLWYWVTLGSKFWQVRWEAKLAQVEAYYVARGAMPIEFELFSKPTSNVKLDVELELKREKRDSWFSRFIDTQVLRKPSVTLAMIRLSVLFAVVWLILFATILLREKAF
jgi:hypothetical protein